MGFLAFALLFPETGEARGGAEFERFGLLVLGYADGVLKTGFGFSLMIRSLLQEEFAFEALEFCVVEMLSRLFDGSQRFTHYGESFVYLPSFPIRFSE